MTDSDIVARLRAITWTNMAMLGSDALCQEAADEIERLRAERDEARREVCRDEAWRKSPSPPCTARQIAERRGWDCFHETDGE